MFSHPGSNIAFIYIVIEALLSCENGIVSESLIVARHFTPGYQISNGRWQKEGPIE